MRQKIDVKIDLIPVLMRCYGIANQNGSRSASFIAYIAGTVPRREDLSYPLQPAKPLKSNP